MRYDEKLKHFVDTEMSDNNEDFVIALKRESKSMKGLYDRVCWSKSEKRFIYGDERSYTLHSFVGNIPEYCCTEEHKEELKMMYNHGITLCKHVVI